MAEHDTTPGSPAWWLKALEDRLGTRAADAEEYRRYYDGEHRLAFATKRFLDAFGGMFREFADNWCAVVVDAVEERLDIEGFRFGDSAGDTEAWRIWQANALDVESQLAHHEAITCGSSAVMVWPDDAGEPEITVEASDEVIVARSTANRRRRLAALKKWEDDWGTIRANLYLPDGLYKFEGRKTGIEFVSQRKAPFQTVTWEQMGERIPNPFGDQVPVVELANRPRLKGPGRSEIHTVIPVQNAVNKLLSDLMIAAEYAAMPQRWLTGLEIDEDPDTGQVKPPFDVVLNKLLQVEDPEARFGSFPAADLTNYVGAIEMLVQHIASQSRTPPHYFYLRGEFPSGESIKSAETSLVAKARRKMRFFGEEWEEVIRLSFRLTGDARADESGAETIWADPESRSESEHVDATLKKQALKVPTQQLWEDLGYTQEQIARFKTMAVDEALLELTRPAPPPVDANPAPA